MTTTNKLLCDQGCVASLDSLQTEETKTGLKYKDIVVGTGPSPPTGYQVPRCSCLMPKIPVLRSPPLCGSQVKPLPAAA